MTDQFQHVMVLVSIIIGLGVTQLLSGVSDALDLSRDADRPTTFSVIHTAWAGSIFLWMIVFWWFQFRLLSIVEVWTLWRYLFTVLYAVLLYVLSAVLIPRDWNKASDLDTYFISRRLSFFIVFLMANVADIIDSLLKGGWEYLADVGWLTNAVALATIPIVVIGSRSTSVRIHTVIASLFFAAQLLAVFDHVPTLAN